MYKMIMIDPDKNTIKKGFLDSPEKIQKKIRLANDLFKMAYQLKTQQLRIKFPELTQREINHLAYAQIEKGCQ